MHSDSRIARIASTEAISLAVLTFLIAPACNGGTPAAGRGPSADNAVTSLGVSNSGIEPDEVALVDSSNYPLDRFAPVSVGDGTPSYFLIDTAATMTTIDPRLGFQGSGTASLNVAGGSATQSFFRAPLVTVGHSRATDLNLSVMQLHWGPSVLGQLGSDFLSHFVVEFDYAHNRIRFYDPKAYRNDAPAVAISLEDSIPHVEVSVQVGASKRVAGRFTIDSGFQGDLLLTSPVVTEGGMQPYFDGARLQKNAAGGDVPLKTSSVPGEADLGATSVKGLQPVWADLGPLGRESAGLIGAGLFTRFRVVLDYGNKRLWLLPNQP